jgi:hypothetical protein
MRVKLTYGVGSKIGVNTWHIRKDTPAIPGALSIVTLIKNWYTGIAAEMFPTDMKADYDGTLTEVNTDTPALVGGITPFTVTGSQTANSYGPAGVGFCVGWKSSLASRQGRGRTFVSPISLGGFAADGTITDTRLANVKTATTALVNGSVADGNGAVVVYSTATPKGGVPPAKGHGTARDIVGYAINDKVAWLASRRG